MTTVELKVDLPEDLVEEAKSAGLLSPEEIEQMVRERLRSRRIAKLAQTRRELDSNPIPPMTTQEIQAEIDAYRREARRAAGS